MYTKEGLSMMYPTRSVFSEADFQYFENNKTKLVTKLKKKILTQFIVIDGNLIVFNVSLTYISDTFFKFNNILPKLAITLENKIEKTSLDVRLIKNLSKCTFDYPW